MNAKDCQRRDLTIQIDLFSVAKIPTRDEVESWGTHGLPPCNESLHILWRKRKLLHHRLSWHCRCEWRQCKPVDSSGLRVCFVKLTPLGMPFCNTVSDRLGRWWRICLLD